MRQLLSLSEQLDCEPAVPSQMTQITLAGKSDAPSTKVDYISEAIELFDVGDALQPPASPEPCAYEPSSSVVSRARLSAEQRAKNNREHQRRFRIRNKVTSSRDRARISMTGTHRFGLVVAGEVQGY